MKRMSEVFELPVAGNQVYISPNLIERNKEKGVSNTDVLEHAAHAINNVDALADELAAIVADYEINGFVDKLAISAARNVINAYRGTK